MAARKEGQKVIFQVGRLSPVTTSPSLHVVVRVDSKLLKAVTVFAVHQRLYPQIYLNKDRKASEALLEKVTKLGAAGIMFTVDAAYRSKRTRDVRAKSHVAVSTTYGVHRPVLWMSTLSF